MKVNGAQYLKLHYDVALAGMDPLFHYLTYGQKEGRQVDIPDPVSLPPGWDWIVYVGAYADLQEAGIDTREKAEWHYLDFGYKEGRWPVPGVPPPITQGLRLILDIPGSRRPLFTGMKYKDGLLIGDYGYGVGGAKIQYWDGTTVKDEVTFPTAESAFHLVPADDGVPICSLELFSLMARRASDGGWDVAHDSTTREDLCFGIFKHQGAFHCLCCTGGKNISYLLRSLDQGKTWNRTKTWENNSQGCCSSDGQRILFSDHENNVPVIRDYDSAIVTRRNDLPGKTYTQVSGKAGRWTFGGNNTEGGFGAFIDYWDGNGVPRTVFTSDRRYIMWTECDPNSERRVAVFGPWKEQEGTAQLAYSLDGGITWTGVDVPCNNLFGTHFAAGGAYLFGGDWGSGRVYCYDF